MIGTWRMFLGAVIMGVALSVVGCFLTSQSTTDKFGAGGATTATATTGAGGTGPGVPCSPTSSCKDDDANPCTKEECIDGFCVVTSLTMDVGPGSTECVTNVCKNGVNAPTTHENGPCGTNLKCNSDGQCTGCLDVSTCPKPLDCEVVDCKNMVCEVKNAPVGTPSKKVANTPNDCKKPVCDGSGGIDFALDDMDHPLDDKNPCTDQACDVTGPIYPPSVKGTMCASMTKPNVKVCDGSSVCVECVGDADCTDANMVLPSCDTNTLVCVSCSDKKQNGAETGVDCGGGICKKCDGDICGQGDQCKSGVCPDSVCCNTACSGPCLACDLPGNSGTCNPVSKGLEDPGCNGSGKACNGSGVCASNVVGKAGAICFLDAECYTGACYGMCRLPNFAPCAEDAECASLLCLANVCTACSMNPQCASNMCSGSGQCLIPGGGVCSHDEDCAGGSCDIAVTHLCGKSNSQQSSCTIDAECMSFHCANNKCAACGKQTQVADCVSDKCDSSGNCLLPNGEFCTDSSQCAVGMCKGFPARCL